jgi:hypothetical protein
VIYESKDWFKNVLGLSAKKEQRPFPKHNGVLFCYLSPGRLWRPVKKSQGMATIESSRRILRTYTQDLISSSSALIKAAGPKEFLKYLRERIMRFLGAGQVLFDLLSVIPLPQPAQQQQSSVLNKASARGERKSPPCDPRCHIILRTPFSRARWGLWNDAPALPASNNIFSYIQQQHTHTHGGGVSRWKRSDRRRVVISLKKRISHSHTRSRRVAFKVWGVLNTKNTCLTSFMYLVVGYKS